MGLYSYGPSTHLRSMLLHESASTCASACVCTRAASAHLVCPPISTAFMCTDMCIGIGVCSPVLACHRPVLRYSSFSLYLAVHLSVYLHVCMSGESAVTGNKQRAGPTKQHLSQGYSCTCPCAFLCMCLYTCLSTLLSRCACFRP